MMKAFESFLTLPEQDKRDVFYNRLPVGHPRLLFKGGTSLSTAFGLIRRFSEDIDLVVFHDDLGFKGDRDATARLEPLGADEAGAFEPQAVEGSTGHACELGDGGLGNAQLEEATDVVLLAVEP